jgi:hypothetical protein
MFDPERFYRPREVVTASNAPRDLVYAALHAGALRSIRRGEHFLIPGWAASEWVRDLHRVDGHSQDDRS